ncbi:hypothetical protein UlMin_030112 [Ulmus minor]
MWFLFNRAGRGFLCRSRSGFSYQQKCGLVNVKLKWAKDNALDAIVTDEKDLKAASILVTVISSVPQCCLPIYHLFQHRGQLGLPQDLKLSTFIRRYPSIFVESHILDSGGTRVPCFSLTRVARELRQEELHVLEQNQMDQVNRLRKLLIITRDWILPLQTIDQLRWDFGLPYDYHLWDDDLAVSELQKNFVSHQEANMKNGCLAFPIRFTRGFGLKRKLLEEWQKLPYTSPYSDASPLDPRTDVSEKRSVGVFHELLHLTIQKKTERKNLSNLRKPLALPQKFTKVFERHPGIFYISKKCDTQTIILREAYDGWKLLKRHPLVEIRENFASMLGEGLLDRSRGLYKKTRRFDEEEVGPSDFVNDVELSDNGSSSEDLLTDYISDSDYHPNDSHSHRKPLRSWNSQYGQDEEFNGTCFLNIPKWNVDSN